jgi:hypothetical protein
MVEKRISQIVTYHRGSDIQIKAACIAAARVVGSYDGTTGVIAKQTKRSVASVENWAHAFRLYNELRTNLADFRRVRCLWRSLPASHWWLAYDIQTSGYDALYYLDNADKHAWSGRDMLKEWRQDRENGGAPLILKRACYAFAELAKELSQKHIGQLTTEQQKAVIAVRKAFA